MKNLCLALWLNILAIGLFAQSPYQLSPSREAAWLGGGAAGIGVSLLLAKRALPFTPTQISGLDANAVFSLDRPATRLYSASAQRGSDLLLAISPLFPLLLLVDPAIRRDAGKVTLIASETILFNAAITLMTKEVVHRPRPYVYNPQVPLSLKVNRDARQSFFSGHTSTVAVMSFSAAKIWTDYHPESGWKPAVWCTAVALPAVTGLLRVKGGKHYPTDVLTGLVMGAAIAWLVPQLHRRK